MHDKNNLKVLVIRFSSIGDIVLCTPVLRCLKKIPGQQIEVHFLTKKKFAGFVASNPNVDRVIALENKIGDILPELKRQQYDFIVDLHNNMRSHVVKFSLQRPARSFGKLNFKKWLLTNFKIDRMPDIHIVDRYLNAAKPLGILNDHLGLDYFIPENEEVSPESLPAAFRDGFVGFVIGGTYATKRLPNDMIIRICKKINFPLVLLGGPEDQENGDIIAGEAGAKVFNACGRFSLNGSASLIRQSRAVISHDTGLMHIAAAFSKPIASIWGNTVPQLGMFPYFAKSNKENPSKIFEVKGLSCRPCSKIGYNQCPKTHFKCMKDMPVDEMVKWVNEIVVNC